MALQLVFFYHWSRDLYSVSRGVSRSKHNEMDQDLVTTHCICKCRSFFTLEQVLDQFSTTGLLFPEIWTSAFLMKHSLYFSLYVCFGWCMFYILESSLLLIISFLKQFTTFNLLFFFYPAPLPLLLTSSLKAALQMVLTTVACSMNMGLCEATQGWERKFGEGVGPSGECYFNCIVFSWLWLGSSLQI